MLCVISSEELEEILQFPFLFPISYCLPCSLYTSLLRFLSEPMQAETYPQFWYISLKEIYCLERIFFSCSYYVRCNEKGICSPYTCKCIDFLYIYMHKNHTWSRLKCIIFVMFQEKEYLTVKAFWVSWFYTTKEQWTRILNSELLLEYLIKRVRDMLPEYAQVSKTQQSCNKDIILLHSCYTAQKFPNSNQAITYSAKNTVSWIC